MRDIKFRAWKQPTKSMHYGVYPHGRYVCFPNSLPLPVEKQTTFSGTRQDGYFEAHKCELMQYTGLKDKNGVEIYEGDIVTTQDYTNFYKIIFEDGRFIMVDKENMNDVTELRAWYIGTNAIEVIGNIYENKELLG